jgi:festuclavine dehydrogenase
LGRKIVHVKISEDEEAVRMESFGIPGDYARMLAELDTHISQGKEDITSDVIPQLGRKEPRGLESFLEEYARKGAWEKK